MKKSRKNLVVSAIMLIFATEDPNNQNKWQNLQAAKSKKMKRI